MCISAVCWWARYVSTQSQMRHHPIFFFFFISVGRWDLPQTANVSCNNPVANVLRWNWNGMNALFSSHSCEEVHVYACTFTRSPRCCKAALISTIKQRAKRNERKTISPFWRNLVLNQPLLFVLCQCIQLFSMRRLHTLHVTVLTNNARVDL